MTELIKCDFCFGVIEGCIENLKHHVAVDEDGVECGHIADQVNGLDMCQPCFAKASKYLASNVKEGNK